MERPIVAIDVGTTKMCTLVGEVGENGDLRVIGVGVVPSQGLHKSEITDVEEAAEAIGRAVQRAEQVSGHTVTEAYVGIGGGHISSQNSRGVVAIGKGDRPIDRDDIDRAMESALAITLPHNRRVIHCRPREFIVDGHDGVKNPLGLMGFRLEVEAHIITGAGTSIQNLIHCVEMNEIEVVRLVAQPLASAEAVLTEEEKTMGVVMIDVGAGTTDLVISVEGSPWETQVLRVGGNQLTRDIAVGLRTPLATAEDLKVRYAHAAPEAIDEDEKIEITTFGDGRRSTVSRRRLCRVLAARLEEMLELIAREVKRSGFGGLLAAGVVITGGTANLRGIRDVAAELLQLPVRIGMPRRLRGLTETISSPAYATSVGLLLWGMRERAGTIERGPRTARKGAWYGRLADWLTLFLPRG